MEGGAGGKGGRGRGDYSLRKTPRRLKKSRKGEWEVKIAGGGAQQHGRVATGSRCLLGGVIGQRRGSVSEGKGAIEQKEIELFGLGL